ncbi:MAG: bifunctional 4-hydroxy-2-oxoglutarate aldolase/2-dehydro-3-deoxy-phosphogluconate aldolase [Chitinophagaceae bacterium]
MSNKKFSWDRFYRLPVIGIVRGLTMDEIKNVLPVYAEAGLTTIEITMNTAGAGEMIAYIRKKYPALNTGAGTVCTEKDLSAAKDAGAQFVVTPVVSKKVIASCVKLRLPVFPGALTPTEIYQAWSLGASMVKIYPAKTMGAGYIRDIKAPLNKVKLLPTGGIGLEDIAAYREAGADGFGIGSPLFLKSLIAAKNWEGLMAHFKHFVNAMEIRDH